MRRIVLLLAALAVGLSACAPAQTPAPATSAPAAAELTAQPARPTSAATAAPAVAPKATQPPATVSPATPDIEKIVRAQPDDHKYGAQTANVTIIEWGDFQ